MDQLNEAMVDGISVTECHILDDRAKNAMSLVAAADYTVRFRDGKQPENEEEFFKNFLVFAEQNHILITKKTKKSEKEVDLKASIYELRVENGTIFMKVAAGSADNLKPELVMEAYDQWRGQTSPDFTFQVQREEVYGNTGDEENKILVPLGLIGESVE